MLKSSPSALQNVTVFGHSILKETPVKPRFSKVFHLEQFDSSPSSWEKMSQLSSKTSILVLTALSC